MAKLLHARSGASPWRCSIILQQSLDLTRGFMNSPLKEERSEMFPRVKTVAGLLWVTDGVLCKSELTDGNDLRSFGWRVIEMKPLPARNYHGTEEVP